MFLHALLLTLSSLLIVLTVRTRSHLMQNINNDLNEPEPDTAVPAESSKRVIQVLQEALPTCVLVPSNADAEAFNVSVDDYFAQQSKTTRPACIVRPGTVEHLSRAVGILHREFVARKACGDGEGDLGFVSVRSGGHSYARASAGVEGGVLLDLSRFCEVAISEDESSVTVGTGARWSQVYEVLEGKGVVVPGGRNAAVGVGGFTLGGGISFFSQRFGLACSNVTEYEVVLASGKVVLASATSNPKLWRALKGGSSNFGMVKRFTFRAFASSGNIWGGCLFSPSFESSRSIDLFHKFVGRADPKKTDVEYDDYASGPIVCFCYLQRPGMEIISTFITYTKEPPSGSEWPACWKKSGFKSIWRYWNTVKRRTLSSACQDLAIGEKAGLSQNIAGTIVKNDKATLEAAYSFYREACTEVKKVKGKGIRFVFVMQPLLPAWMHKGDPNYLGLENTLNEPHVQISFKIPGLKDA